MFFKKKLILVLFLIILVFISACTKSTEKTSEEGLGDLQIIACTEADRAGTCQTRLVEVGIIMPNECCEELGRCC